MSPISSILPTMPGYGVMPDMDVARPGLRTPATPSVTEPDALVPTPATTPVEAPSESFANMLGRMVQDVNAKQVAASDAVNALQSGQNVPLHQTVIAMEEASVSFQLMLEVRNKLLDSYQEIMRMSV